MSIVVEALTARHDRSKFESCSEPLDRYLRQQASQDARRGVARVFVAVPDDDPEVVGFYTLSAASIERYELPPEAARGRCARLGSTESCSRADPRKQAI